MGRGSARLGPGDRIGGTVAEVEAVGSDRGRVAVARGGGVRGYRQRRLPGGRGYRERGGGRGVAGHGPLELVCAAVVICPWAGPLVRHGRVVDAPESLDVGGGLPTDAGVC